MTTESRRTESDALHPAVYLPQQQRYGATLYKRSTWPPAPPHPGQSSGNRWPATAKTGCGLQDQGSIPDGADRLWGLLNPICNNNRGKTAEARTSRLGLIYSRDHVPLSLGHHHAVCLVNRRNNSPIRQSPILSTCCSLFIQYFYPTWAYTVAWSSPRPCCPNHQPKHHYTSFDTT
jgi:hypothetical protein